MKKIINHLKENWIKYGFETFVIVVGILGAFTLNKWNDSRKLDLLEVQYLERLVSDLATDTAYYRIRIDQADKDKTSLSNFLERIYEPQSKIEDVRSTMRFLRFGTNPLTTHNPSYLELSSSGNLSIFKNLELKSSISGYYRNNEDFAAQVDEYNAGTTQLLYDVTLQIPTIPRYLSALNDDQKIFNDEEWKFINNPRSKDFQALEGLAMIMYLRNNEFMGYFEELHKEAIGLIQQINQEIETRRE